jgi:hypothetical protein
LVVNYNYVAPPKTFEQSFKEALPLLGVTGGLSFCVFTCIVGNFWRLYQRNEANSPKLVLRARRNGAGELEVYWKTIVEPVVKAFFDEFNSTTCQVRDPDSMYDWTQALIEILKEFHYAHGDMKGKRLTALSAFAKLGDKEPADSDRKSFIKFVNQEIRKFFPEDRNPIKCYSVGPTIPAADLQKQAKGIGLALVGRTDVKFSQNNFARSISSPKGGSVVADSAKSSGRAFDFKAAGGDSAVEMTLITVTDGKDSERPLLTAAAAAASPDAGKHSRESSGGSGSSGHRKAADVSAQLGSRLGALEKTVTSIGEALSTQGMWNKPATPPSSPPTPAITPATAAVPPPPPPTEDVGVSIMSPSAANA